MNTIFDFFSETGISEVPIQANDPQQVACRREREIHRSIHARMQSNSLFQNRIVGGPQLARPLYSGRANPRTSHFPYHLYISVAC